MRRPPSVDCFGVARGARLSTYGALAAGCLLFAVTVAAAFTIYGRMAPPASSPALTATRDSRAQSDAAMRTGTIQFAPTRDNLCPQFEFDNKSGGLRAKGSTACDAPGIPADRDSDPRYNTFNQIRDSFNKR
jgi:hypothetical protein